MTRQEQIDLEVSRISELEIELLKANETLTYLNSLIPISGSELFTLLGSITKLEDQDKPNFDIKITTEQYQEGTFKTMRVVTGKVINITTSYHFENEQIEAIERYLRSLGDFGILKITK